MNVKEFHKNGQHIRYDSDIFNNLDDVSFNSRVWAQRSSIVGFAEGRGTTFFIQHQDRDFVLRHYQRGGLVTRVSKEKYFWLGLTMPIWCKHADCFLEQWFAPKIFLSIRRVFRIWIDPI